MKLNHNLLILIVVLVFAGSLLAQGNLGQSGANFLQIPPDAAGAALGGAAVAQATGATALYWNPAGITEVSGMDINLAYTNWMVDTRLTHAAFVMPLSSNNALGISVTSFGMDDLEITTERDPDDWTREGNKVKRFDYGFAAGFRYRFFNFFIVEILYEHGLADVVYTPNVPENPVHKNRTLSLMIGFRI